MRTATITEKVQTNFGNIFIHLDCATDGRVVGIAFSQPGKLENSTIGNALDALSSTLNAMIPETARRSELRGLPDSKGHSS